MMSFRNMLGLISFTGIGLLSASSAYAIDGTIQFQGSILDTACTVDVGSTDKTMTVKMGQIAKASFTGAGSTAGATKFSISLSACPETVKTAAITFDGTAYAGDDSVLALNNETGVATNVGIQISDKSDAVITLSTPSPAYTLTTGEKAVTKLDFYARYIAKAAAVTAGPANATSTFTMSYN